MTTLITDWVDIPGYDGKYQANFFGDIRRVYAKSKKTKTLTPYHKKMTGSQRLVVKLTKDGKSKECIVMQLIARTFIGECPPGCMAYHKNGLQTDNCAGNIAYIKRSELGKLTGPTPHRKPVAKINSDFEIVEVYASARAAAKANFMSYQTVIDRCNGKIKKSTAPDGFDYVWDDSEVSLRRARERIERAKRRGAANERPV